MQISRVTAEIILPVERCWLSMLARLNSVTEACRVAPACLLQFYTGEHNNVRTREKYSESHAKARGWFFDHRTRDSVSNSAGPVCGGRRVGPTFLHLHHAG